MKQRSLLSVLIPLAVVAVGLTFVLAVLAAPAPSSKTSGVRGVASLGPTCPVVQVGVSCPDQPLAGVKIAVAGHKATTDAKGRFKIGLAPGVYRLVATSDAGISGAREIRKVTVQRGSFTAVSLSFDSGIR